MAQNVELALQEWYEKMEASPGIYDGLREIGEDGSIGPQQRLQEMFLKRLDGFSVQIFVPHTEEFGEVSINGAHKSFDFDMSALRADGMTSVLPFVSDRGVTGEVRLDWQSSTMTFVPASGEPSVYLITEYLQPVMEYGVGHKLTIGLLCIIAPLLDEDFEERSFLSNLSINKLYVEGLIFANREAIKASPLFTPQARVTFKEVAEITGVSASTLSNVRNGKKSLENLTWNTLSVLSFYAQIRMLDSAIIDMLRRQLSGEVSPFVKEAEAAVSTDDREALNAEWIATEGQKFEVRCVVVALRDGTSYKLDGNHQKGTELLYDAVLEQYEGDRSAMDLKFAVTDSGEKLHRVMVPKADIHHIRMDRYKPYANGGQA